jgi:drug/metabolite transporter (DMT)-like permease
LRKNKAELLFHEGHMQQHKRATVFISLATLYLAWSSTYLAIRIALESFPPFFIAGFRYMLVGAGIYLYLRIKGVSSPTAAQWGGSTIAGVFLLLGGTAGVVYAEQWVGSGIAALVLATAPLLTVLFAMLWKHRPARSEWLGMLLGFIGIVLLNIEGDLRAHPLGAALLILASSCWSLGSVLSLHVPMPSGMMASASQMFSGGLIVLLVSVSAGERLYLSAQECPSGPGDELCLREPGAGSAARCMAGRGADQQRHGHGHAGHPGRRCACDRGAEEEQIRTKK